MKSPSTSGYRSVIDDVPVVNQAFKTFPDYSQPIAGRIDPQPSLKVVSTCSTCGSPVYGPESTSSADDIVVQRTCGCHYLNAPQRFGGQQKDIRDSWKTK